MVLQEHIPITKSNLNSWLVNSATAKESKSGFASMDLEGGSTTTPESRLKDSLGLKPGDQVFLSRRPRLPSGGATAAGRVRLAIFEEAQKIG